MALDRALYSAIDAILPDYPGGLPTRLLSEVASAPPGVPAFQLQGSARSGVAFVGCWQPLDSSKLCSGSEGELLGAAIEKGLKLSLESVLLLCASSSEIMQRNRPQINSTVGAESVRVVVALGEAFGDAVLQEVFPRAQLVRTKALSEIVAQDAMKRIFWGDLKRVLKLLEGAV